jgi:hypothetical protein
MRRREFIAGLGSAAAWPMVARAQQPGNPSLKRVRTGTLEIAYEDSGPTAGFPVLLMHGFPYDPRCYDEVVPPLVAAGYRAIVPYLRGYGATRFLAADIASGISIISTQSAVAPGLRRTDVNSASCYGSCGRPIGSSTTLPTSVRPVPSTIRISSMSSSIPTATSSATRPATRR